MNDIAVYIALAVFASGFAWVYLSKLFGGIMMLGSGLGMMMTTSGNDTWVGLIVLMVGLGLTINSLFEKPNKRKKR